MSYHGLKIEPDRPRPDQTEKRFGSKHRIKDCIGQSIMEEFKGYKFPLAVAIVCSGQYEDDEDNREEIDYAGQGGNDFHGTKRQITNQEMSPGNLALK
nr:histone-lysine N-methyltransferase, H3 lysine-9 specific SUVH4 [Tanacetum cinerariifolium]